MSSEIHSHPTGEMPHRILIVRLGAMGDIIHGMPAIAALRRAKPNLKIGWLVEERWTELLSARSSDRLAERSPVKPLVDWVHIANFSRWRKALLSKETRREMQACLHEVRNMGYDLALDLQGSIRSSLAARLSGARMRIGSAAAP